MLQKLEEDGASVWYTKHKMQTTIKPINRTTDIDSILKEIDALLLQGHDGIVQLYSAHAVQHSIWLEMEYCDGGSLNKFFWEIQRNFDSSLKFQLIVEMACAVQYLHNNGVVHQDLKPENILTHYVEPIVADHIPRSVILVLRKYSQVGNSTMTSTSITFQLD